MDDDRRGIRGEHEWQSVGGARLRDVALFASLSSRELDELLTVSTWKRHRRGEQLKLARAGHEVALVVEEGEIWVSRISIEGRIFTQYRVKRGGLVGLKVALGDNAEEITAEAMQEGTRVVYIPWPLLLAVASSHPESASVLIEQEQLRRREAETLSAELALHDVHARVRHTVGRLAAEDPDQVIRYGVDAIARLSGTSVRQASRAIAYLLEQGLIERPRQRAAIVVPDPDALL